MSKLFALEHVERDDNPVLGELDPTLQDESDY